MTVPPCRPSRRTTTPRSSCPRRAPGRATGPARPARCSSTAPSGSPTGCAARSPTAAASRVVVARSTDGVAFEPVAEVHREAFGCESFERPVLVPVPGRRLAALPLLRDVRLQALVGRQPHRRHPEELPTAAPAVVLPGDDRAAVKDPVVTHGPDGWEMWLCCHPLDRARPRGPDDHPPPDQPRRPRVDRPRRGARRPRRRVGRARRPRHRRRWAATRSPCCTTAAPTPPPTGTRPPAWPAGTASRLVPDDELGPIASPHSDGACATPPRCRCRTAGPASTSRPPAPTARTTSSPACADVADCRDGAVPGCPAAERRSLEGPRLAVESQSEKSSPVSSESSAMSSAKRRRSRRAARRSRQRPVGRRRAAELRRPAGRWPGARPAAARTAPSRRPARTTGPEQPRAPAGLDVGAGVVARDR